MKIFLSMRLYVLKFITIKKYANNWLENVTEVTINKKLFRRQDLLKLVIVNE